ALGGFVDASGAPTPEPFRGGADFDGVAVSMDGVRWYEVQSLRNLPLDYTELVVPLDAAVAAHGLTYNGNFRIRFNTVSEFSMPFSGLALDDLSITSEPSSIQPAVFAGSGARCWTPNQALDH